MSSGGKFKTYPALIALALILFGCVGESNKSVSEWMASISADQIDYKKIRTKTKNSENLDK